MEFSRKFLRNPIFQCFSTIFSMLPKEVHCFIYADDVKLFSLCPVLLQRVINSIADYAANNSLIISVSKCCVTNCGHRNNNSAYFINDLLLPSPNIVKDPGILFTNNFNITDLINLTVKKATSCMNLILRAFRTLSVTVLLRAYRS